MVEVSQTVQDTGRMLGKARQRQKRVMVFWGGTLWRALIPRRRALRYTPSKVRGFCGSFVDSRAQVEADTTTRIEQHGGPEYHSVQYFMICKSIQIFEDAPGIKLHFWTKLSHNRCPPKCTSQRRMIGKSDEALLVLLSLDEGHGWHILVPAVDHVIHSCEDENGAIDDNGPEGWVSGWCMRRSRSLRTNSL